MPPQTRENDMFLDVKELAVRKVRVRKNYAPGTLDFGSSEFRQVGPLELKATAELLEGQIRIFGQFHTRIELVCARCLEPVIEEISKDFDLFYRPFVPAKKEGEIHLKDDDTDIGFFQGQGMFIGDVLAEQVNLMIPMKVICRSDCRGLCPHCGANLNHENCRCEVHATDPRMAPLARVRQDWFKKQ